MIYLDSSAVVKLARREAETDALRAWLATHPGPLVSSALTRTESARALARTEPAALPVLWAVLGLIHQMPVTDGVLDRAARLPGPTLRSLDAIHLATAEELTAEESAAPISAFVVYDKRLADSAGARGLPAVAPE